MVFPDYVFVDEHNRHKRLKGTYALPYVNVLVVIPPSPDL